MSDLTAGDKQAIRLIDKVETLHKRIAELEAMLDLRLPCDVKLEPATVITKGCTLHTLAAGLQQRLKYESQ